MSHEEAGNAGMSGLEAGVELHWLHPAYATHQDTLRSHTHPAMARGTWGEHKTSITQVPWKYLHMLQPPVVREQDPPTPCVHG